MRVIDETIRDLGRLIGRELGFPRRGTFDSDFLAWLHHRARRVPMLSRRVHVSPEVLRQQEKFPAIAKIRYALQTGSSVEAWLSVKTRQNKADPTADMMFNDWQVLHFHLGNIYQSQEVIRRSGKLLYGHVTGEEATLLDVRPHGAWTQRELLEILLRTNAPALRRHEARGVTPSQLTDEQLQSLRANNTNALVEIAGRGFMPGMGLMSSGHAVRLVLYKDWFFRMAVKLREQLEADHVEQHLKAAIYTRLGVPVRLGAYYDDHGLALIDRNRDNLVLHQMKPIE